MQLSLEQKKRMIHPNKNMKKIINGSISRNHNNFLASNQNNDIGTFENNENVSNTDKDEMEKECDESDRSH